MAERILIWGAGAIGGSVGAWLKRAGHDISFVDVVPEHVAAIRGTGPAHHRTGRGILCRRAGVHAGRGDRHLAAHLPRGEGAAHRGGDARADAASGAGRLRAVAAEWPQRD